jgi:hypothetical protein
MRSAMTDPAEHPGIAGDRDPRPGPRDRRGWRLVAYGRPPMDDPAALEVWIHEFVAEVRSSIAE